MARMGFHKPLVLGVLKKKKIVFFLAYLTLPFSQLLMLYFYCCSRCFVFFFSLKSTVFYLHTYFPYWITAISYCRKFQVYKGHILCQFLRGKWQKIILPGNFIITLVLMYTIYSHFYTGLHLYLIQVSEDSANSLRNYLVQDFLALYVMQDPELMVVAYFKLTRNIFVVRKASL